ncbi:DinB family protein [Paenibacillus segetis]|uniref:DinB superfamily protein n=1 Tax=Paenibacillus segetis TaxID=1325360 RepID=A0ABQ1YJT1_9BACL|nr:DinB family protein [Paenibacillus segetis]GGH27215.1 hypothetical protein GCM10008013_28550 [Paenibacillus segetis]
MDIEQRKLWNENHKKLTSIIYKPTEHENAIELFLNQHALLYASKIENSQVMTLEDELLNNMTDETFRKYPVVSPDTRNSIVWQIWHISRIEDMTMNVLVGNQDQVFFSGDWVKKLNINCTHTGNEMTENEVAELSANIDINALLSYRLEVGRATRTIVKSLQPGQFKQKVESVRIEKLLDQGAVKKEATWLLDYWGKKDTGGLILMPATRHNFLHLNKSIRIKNKIQK